MASAGDAPPNGRNSGDVASGLTECGVVVGDEGHVEPFGTLRRLEDDVIAGEVTTGMDGAMVIVGEGPAEEGAETVAARAAIMFAIATGLLDIKKDSAKCWHSLFVLDCNFLPNAFCIAACWLIAARISLLTEQREYGIAAASAIGPPK